MKTYVAIHSHRFGVSIELFKTDKDMTGIDSNEIAKLLEFDYDDSIGAEESIEIFPVNLKSIKTI
jgi:hypothetical protein